MVDEIDIRYPDVIQNCFASGIIIVMRLIFNSAGDLLSYRVNFELILTEPVLVAVKKYYLNLPEICINAIVAEIERLHTSDSTVIQTTSSREREIRELKEELQMMREKLKEAEATLATQKSRV
jgi:hypothetical protein